MLDNIKTSRYRILLSFFSGLLFVYILLFELILPQNKVLPKPSILIDSVHSLFVEYNFGSALLLTFGAIYSIFILSYFMLKISSSIITTFKQIAPALGELLIFKNYFLPIFLIFLFESWFGSSMWGEYLFLFILIMGSFKAVFMNNIDALNDEYLIAAKSLGVSEKVMKRDIVFKMIQPKIYESIKSLHPKIWGLAIVYEFICKTDGVGNIFYLAIKYNDFGLLVLTIILLTVIIFIMEIMIGSIKKKYFFWN